MINEEVARELHNRLHEIYSPKIVADMLTQYPEAICAAAHTLQEGYVLTIIDKDGLPWKLGKIAGNAT